MDKQSRQKALRWWEYVVRFAFGGAITVVAGVIANVYGPVVGGLFLAFPAILPASVTMVKRHDGEDLAGINALGAAFGSAGLLAFGAVVWILAPRAVPWLVLAVGTVAWLIVAFVAWLALHRVVEPYNEEAEEQSQHGASAA
jgi:hypothetical protein